MTQKTVPVNSTKVPGLRLVWLLLFLFLGPRQFAYAQHYTLLGAPGGAPRCYAMAGDTVFLLHNDQIDGTPYWQTKVMGYRMTDHGPIGFFDPVVGSGACLEASVRRVGERLVFYALMNDPLRHLVFAMDLDGRILWQNVMAECPDYPVNPHSVLDRHFAANEHEVVALYLDFIPDRYFLVGNVYGWDGSLRRRIMVGSYLKIAGMLLCPWGDRFVAFGEDSLAIIDSGDVSLLPSHLPYGYAVTLDTQFDEKDLFCLIPDSASSHIERLRLRENDLAILQRDTLVTGLTHPASGRYLTVQGRYCIFTADTMGAAVAVYQDCVGDEVIPVCANYGDGVANRNAAAYVYHCVNTSTHEIYRVQNGASERLCTYNYIADVAFGLVDSQYLQVIHYNYATQRIEVEVLPLEEYFREVQQEAFAPQLSAYPNPFLSSCCLSLPPGVGDRQVRIYNLLGQELQCLHLPANGSSLDWTPPTRTAGVYLLRTAGGSTRRLLYLP